MPSPTTSTDSFSIAEIIKNIPTIVGSGTLFIAAKQFFTNRRNAEIDRAQRLYQEEYSKRVESEKMLIVSGEALFHSELLVAEEKGQKILALADCRVKDGRIAELEREVVQLTAQMQLAQNRQLEPMRKLTAASSDGTEP